MPPDKLLAEWFWIDRWMGSSAFLLPMEAQGVYRAMLTQAWRRGARLPNDHEAIQRAIGCTAKEWRRTWPLIERFWQIVNGELINETQVEVYADALSRQEKAIGRAIKGAEGRWGKRNQSSTYAVSNAQALPVQCPPISDHQSPISDHRISQSDRSSVTVTDFADTVPLDEAFELFKAEYPGHRRVDNFMTRQRFVDACQRIGFPNVLAKLREQKLSPEWLRGLIPSMGKWLEDKHYERELAPVVNDSGRTAIVPGKYAHVSQRDE